VVMEHVDKAGASKFVGRCGLPLTGAGVVDMLITDLAVFELAKDRPPRLVELAPGVALEAVRAQTGASFET